jgi:tetratricopeptide (TPR) repeat protein
MIWLLAIQLAVGPIQHYETAQQDFAQQKYSEAVDEVDAALHENPEMVSALILKARLATFARRPDVARSCLITAITVDPLSEEAQFYLGLLLYTQNEFDSAVPPLQAAHKLSPNSPLPVFYLAMIQEALGHQAEALELYRQAANLSPGTSPQSAEILVPWGRLLLTLGRTDDGIAKERQAVAIDPRSRDAHYELAIGLNHNEDIQNAAREGELALTLTETADVSDAQIHFLLTGLYRMLNRPDLAKAHLEKFLAAKKETQK